MERDVVRRALALGVIGMVGCAALVGIDQDYTVGDLDGGLPEGSDSPLGDSPMPSDGNPPPFEAGPDGSVLHACAKYPTDAGLLFCDDFDEGKALGAGWSSQAVTPGATLAIVTDASASSPGSLCATAIDASSASLAYQSVVKLSSFVAVEADVRFDQSSGPASNAVQPLEVGLQASGSAQWRARLDVYPDHAELEEFQLLADGGFGFDFNGLAQHPALGQWVHVRIEVNLVAKTLSVYFDGTPVILNHVSKYQWPTGETPMMTVGIVEARWGFVGPWQFHVDNTALFAN
jgi:hypothetical protein